MPIPPKASTARRVSRVRVPPTETIAGKGGERLTKTDKEDSAVGLRVRDFVCMGRDCGDL